MGASYISERRIIARYISDTGLGKHIAPWLVAICHILQLKYRTGVARLLSCALPVGGQSACSVYHLISNYALIEQWRVVLIRNMWTNPWRRVLHRVIAALRAVIWDTRHRQTTFPWFSECWNVCRYKRMNVFVAFWCEGAATGCEISKHLAV